MERENIRIAVAGAGYVGLACAVLLAQRNQVTVVDPLPEKVEKINSRVSPLADREIEAYLAERPLRLTATADGDSAYRGADFVVVATPTDYDPVGDHFDTASVESVIRQVLRVNPEAAVVIRSTVPVGYTAAAREKLGCRRLLAAPEFLREGSALYDNLHPSRIVVGAAPDDPESVAAARRFAGLLLEGAEEKDVPVLLMRPSEAEAVKLFANTYLALRVAFFNELDTYAELLDLDTRKIIEGVGCDRRIGQYYNNPSFGYGGYCLPKDTRQLRANFAHVPNKIISAVVEANDTRKDFVAVRILERARSAGGAEGAPGVIGIYRLTMKADSDNFRQSSVQGIIRRLRERGAELVIFEPGLAEESFLGCPVVRDWDIFVRVSAVIVANRMDGRLEPVREKVYTRDIYGTD